MRDTIFFLGPDDLSKSLIVRNNNGEITIHLAGILPLLQFVDSREIIKKIAQSFFLIITLSSSIKGQ